MHRPGLALLVAVAAITAAAPASGQPVLVSGVASQSWMLNPGNRGDGPLDHGTLAGVSGLWVIGARGGIELGLAASDIRPRDLGPGPFYQGRIVNAFSVLGTYFLRGFDSGRTSGIVPYISVGGGILRIEQRYTFLDRVHPTREFGFPIEAGAGVLVFVAPRVALRTDVRWHPGEEQMLRVLAGAGYLFGASRPERRQPTLPPAARTTPAAVVEITGGYTPFFDDGGALPHVAVGADARRYISSGVAFGPELLFAYGSADDRDLMIAGTVTFDLRSDASSSGVRQVVPYLVVNGGILTHWFRYGSRDSVSGPVVSFGGGLRVPVSRTLFVAPEWRIGVEPQMRFTVSLGWRL